MNPMRVGINRLHIVDVYKFKDLTGEPKRVSVRVAVF